jgi:hypothetical protein
MRGWIEAMKTSPRGPFTRIRWFCADGTVLPPKPFACRDHGGGVQHGEWTQRAIEMRQRGYEIANVFADLDGTRFVGPNADLGGVEAIVIERFLVGIDDGWIFRGARSYRGVLQSEDEEAGARRVLLQMLADPGWLTPERYTLLREAVRLFPLQTDQTTSSTVRNLATQIARAQPAFEPLRAKIHSMPDVNDAARVRKYGSARPDTKIASLCEQLAGSIEQLYAAKQGADETAAVLAKLAPAPLTQELKKLVEGLRAATDPLLRFALSAQLLEGLRDSLPNANTPETRLALLRASLTLENEAYAAGNTAVPRLPAATRDEHLQWIDRTTAAIYGVGLTGERELAAMRDSIRRLRSTSNLTLKEYRDELRYLSRVPEWGQRWLRFRFGETMQHLSAIEPLAHRYIRDRLRGSPLIIYGAILDDLLLDANALAGVEHELFGKKVGSGLRALNPGLARGPLNVADPGKKDVRYDAGGIYLLPETTPDLPPVAGILTEGEGSSLSHVQLLARNLCNPNLVVSNQLLPTVRSHRGERVVLAVSQNGIAQLALDGPRWDDIFGAQKLSDSVVLVPDLNKLNVEQTRLVPLSELRESDSGRVSGPKGAKLGELKHAFGDAVPPGFVVPFGVFARSSIADRAKWTDRGTWMVERYARSTSSPATPTKEVVSAFLERLRTFILTVELDPAFLTELRSGLDQMFGAEGTYGVFVRSDTNVEDLQGFTGAGLNLTVPNVVGTANIIEALRQVWASPFTDRAYAWRQARMKDPEYVFPAVLIQYSFPAEKSGVMVTTDLESGEAGWLTIAVNEGVGGAVEGQAAESLRVRASDGTTRFLARATAPERIVLALHGGIAREPARGTPSILTTAEIDQLVALAREVPSRFPSLAEYPADIEFAFRNGKLALLQIRPLVENREAERNRYLSSLDRTLRERADRIVDLKAKPLR